MQWGPFFTSVHVEPPGAQDQMQLHRGEKHRTFQDLKLRTQAQNIVHAFLECEAQSSCIGFCGTPFHGELVRNVHNCRARVRTACSIASCIQHALAPSFPSRHKCIFSHLISLCVALIGKTLKLDLANFRCLVVFPAELGLILSPPADC